VSLLRLVLVGVLLVPSAAIADTPKVLLRAVAVAGALLDTSTAFADRSLEVAGGAAIPIANDKWAARGSTGWKIAGRGTGEVEGHLVVVGLEFARIPDSQCDRFDRFRLMVGLAKRWSTEHVAVSARVAIGADGLSCTFRGSFVPPGVPRTSSQFFDFGIGAEAAVTLWLFEGPVDVGIEAGIPFSVHWHDGDSESPAIAPFAMDLDVLLAIRVR